LATNPQKRLSGNEFLEAKPWFYLYLAEFVASSPDSHNSGSEPLCVFGVAADECHDADEPAVAKLFVVS